MIPPLSTHTFEQQKTSESGKHHTGGVFLGPGECVCSRQTNKKGFDYSSDYVALMLILLVSLILWWHDQPNVLYGCKRIHVKQSCWSFAPGTITPFPPFFCGTWPTLEHCLEYVAVICEAGNNQSTWATPERTGNRNKKEVFFLCMLVW